MDAILAVHAAGVRLNGVVTEHVMIHDVSQDVRLVDFEKAEVHQCTSVAVHDRDLSASHPPCSELLEVARALGTWGPRQSSSFTISNSMLILMGFLQRQAKL